MNGPRRANDSLRIAFENLKELGRSKSLGICGSAEALPVTAERKSRPGRIKIVR